MTLYYGRMKAGGNLQKGVCLLKVEYSLLNLFIAGTNCLARNNLKEGNFVLAHDLSLFSLCRRDDVVTGLCQQAASCWWGLEAAACALTSQQKEQRRAS